MGQSESTVGVICENVLSFFASFHIIASLVWTQVTYSPILSPTIVQDAVR